MVELATVANCMFYKDPIEPRQLNPSLFRDPEAESKNTREAYEAMKKKMGEK